MPEAPPQGFCIQKNCVCSLDSRGSIPRGMDPHRSEPTGLYSIFIINKAGGLIFHKVRTPSAPCF